MPRHRADAGAQRDRRIDPAGEHAGRVGAGELEPLRQFRGVRRRRRRGRLGLDAEEPAVVLEDEVDLAQRLEPVASLGVGPLERDEAAGRRPLGPQQRRLAGLPRAGHEDGGKDARRSVERGDGEAGSIGHPRGRSRPWKFVP
jgi:hypothetical protein